MGDEHDEEKAEIGAVGEDTYLIQGRANLDDIQRLLGISLTTENYNTLSGFIMEQLGRIPGEKETPELNVKGITFKVQEMRKNQISLVKVMIKNRG